MSNESSLSDPGEKEWANSAFGPDDRRTSDDLQFDREAIECPDASADESSDLELQGEKDAEISCRRCSRRYGENLEHCPFCRARNPYLTASSTPVVPRDSDLAIESSVIELFVGYGALLGSSLIMGYGARLLGRDADIQTELLAGLVLDILFAIVATIVCLRLRHVPRPDASPADGPGAWVICVPLLVLMLMVNWSYHQALRGWGVPVIELNVDFSTVTNSCLSVLSYCVFPAIFEEWFFRGALWKTLRTVMSPFATLWIVAFMFGLAHIGVALSVPYLILVGVFLGYARQRSGGLVLPVVMHFLHNLAVILKDHLL